MKVIKKEIDKQLYFPDYIDLEEKVAFLDIETEGLSHSFHRIILIGILVVDKSGTNPYLIQIFAEERDEEKSVLKKFNEIIESVDTVFTYNGASFDIPFIKKRFEKYNLNHNLDSISHIDIYKTIKKNKDRLLLKDCKLKTVEKLVGIERSDTISGKESVLLYKEFLKSKARAVENTILKHNYEDIYYLPDILLVEKMLSQNDILTISYRGKAMKINMQLEKIKMNKSKLKIEAKTPALKTSDYIVFEDYYSFNWDTSSGSISLEILIETDFMEDGRVFSYINTEELNIGNINSISSDFSDQLIPLSIDDKLHYPNIFQITKSIIEKWI